MIQVWNTQVKFTKFKKKEEIFLGQEYEELMLSNQRLFLGNKFFVRINMQPKDMKFLETWIVTLSSFQ